MPSTLLTAALGVVAMTFVGACRHSFQSIGTNQTIVIDGTAFTPNDLTVKVGDAVTWVNKDPFPHNVSSKAGGFASGDLDPDRQWQFRPAAAGAFPYICTLHPGMQGTLHVTP